MNTEKISISLAPSLIKFIEDYKIESGFQSRSAVIESALKLLQAEYLSSAYQQANAEIDPDWEIANSDGLKDETW